MHGIGISSESSDWRAKDYVRKITSGIENIETAFLMSPKIPLALQLEFDCKLLIDGAKHFGEIWLELLTTNVLSWIRRIENITKTHASDHDSELTSILTKCCHALTVSYRQNLQAGEMATLISDELQKFHMNLATDGCQSLLASCQIFFEQVETFGEPWLTQLSIHSANWGYQMAHIIFKYQENGCLLKPTDLDALRKICRRFYMHAAHRPPWWIEPPH